MTRSLEDWRRDIDRAAAHADSALATAGELLAALEASHAENEALRRENARWVERIKQLENRLFDVVSTAQGFARLPPPPKAEPVASEAAAPAPAESPPEPLRRYLERVQVTDKLRVQLPRCVVDKLIGDAPTPGILVGLNPSPRPRRVLLCPGKPGSLGLPTLHRDNGLLSVGFPEVARIFGSLRNILVEVDGDTVELIADGPEDESEPREESDPEDAEWPTTSGLNVLLTDLHLSTLGVPAEWKSGDLLLYATNKPGVVRVSYAVRPQDRLLASVPVNRDEAWLSLSAAAVRAELGSSISIQGIQGKVVCCESSLLVHARR